jgi:anhydro-N-acetylmuramic acid kinase
MTRYLIGLMSGTSVDAIDAALVRISTKTEGHYAAKVLHHTEHPWPKKLRARLLAIMAPAATTTQELCDLNTRVAHEFAQAVETLLAESRTPRGKITALGSHGQTICHLPLKTQNSKRKTQNLGIGSTLQIGDLSVLATLTGIPVVGNFRPADVALGGQGAPLVPWTDAALLSHPSKTRCIQNIGGIANVTYLPSGQWSVASGQKVLAFDTGPGNMLMDALISLSTDGKKRYDHNGQLAARGTLDQQLFKQLKTHPYFRRIPPKSTGREDFGLPFAKHLLTTGHWPLTTLLHTVTQLTAWSIADAYRKFLPHLPDELILCGGGADNPTLLRMLMEEFAVGKNMPAITRIDDYGIPNKAKEAASFALLAAATLDGIPANLPSVTGASRPTLLGVIAPQ